MPAGESGTAIVVERADSAFVVRSADADASGVGFAAALPPEPSRTTVVVDTSAADALHALDPELLWQLVDRLNAGGPGSAMPDVRLVAARAGGPDPSGEAPLAARLAEWLGVSVTAPDGELVALRGGELFSFGPGAGWLEFRAGSSPQWTGPRYPAPAWQAELPREFQPRRPRAFARRRSSAAPVTVTAIPAGLWVRAPGGAPLTPADLGYGVPVEAERPVILIGAPGEPTPDVPELADFFASLPSDLRKSAVLALYGQDPDAYAILVQKLADRLGASIHAYHALPHYAADGTRRFALFNKAGRPDRRVDAPEWVHMAGSAQMRVMPVKEPVARSESRPVAGAASSPGSSVRTVDPDPLSFTPAGSDRWQGDPNATLLDPAVSQGDPNATLLDRIVPQGDPNATVVDPVARQASVRRFDDSAVRLPTSAAGMVTVDARGFLRPCDPARQSVMMPGDVPVPSADTADPGDAFGAGPESRPHDLMAGSVATLAVAGAATNTLVTGGPAESRTVASAVVPEVRSAAHAVTVRSRAAVPPVRGSRAAARPPVGGDESPTVEIPLNALPPLPPLPEMEPGADTASGRPFPDKPVAQSVASARFAETAGDSVVSSPAARSPHEPVAISPMPRPNPQPDQVPEPVPQHEEGPVPRPTEPAIGGPPAGVDRRWLADRVSTPEDRQAFRSSLGWRYDAAASSVARLLAEQPGLRGAGDADEALMTDLAAVRVFATRDQAEFVASVRSGESESDRPFAVCLAAGLRRLPSFQGAVVCGGPADPEAANAYRLGQELTEAAPLTAFDAVDAQVPGAVEFLLWSTTARRLSGFAESGPHAKMAFLPGTVFRVLAVDTEEASPVRRVLLAEIPSGRSPKQTWLDRIMARLEQAAASRAALPQTTAPPGDADRFIVLPGDPTGAPGQYGTP